MPSGRTTWIEWIVFLVAAIAGILVMGAVIEEMLKFFGDDDDRDVDTPVK